MTPEKQVRSDLGYSYLPNRKSDFMLSATILVFKVKSAFKREDDISYLQLFILTISFALTEKKGTVNATNERKGLSKIAGSE